MWWSVIVVVCDCCGFRLYSLTCLFAIKQYSSFLSYVGLWSEIVMGSL